MTTLPKIISNKKYSIVFDLRFMLVVTVSEAVDMTIMEYRVIIVSQINQICFDRTITAKNYLYT